MRGEREGEREREGGREGERERERERERFTHERGRRGNGEAMISSAVHPTEYAKNPHSWS